MQTIAFQRDTRFHDPNGADAQKITQKTPELVEREWPKLLTKKFLAIEFGCWNGHSIIRRRFRNHVLTPEVLQRAGISPEVAYSRSTKTFSALDSIMLTKVLRGFCLASFLFISLISPAQTEVQKLKYRGDTIIMDTIPGLAMLADSSIRMVATGRAGEYRYENVLAPIVVEARMVKQYRYLVRASDGQTEPFDYTQQFYFLSGGLIDPKRLLIFTQNQK